jgi:hypothetical protein
MSTRDLSLKKPEAKHPMRRDISHEAIALHAYYHWERRGKPFGSPDVDWYWAIDDLNHHRPVFHIVGCNHGIQPGTGGFADFDGVDEKEQRGHFRTMVENICVNHSIQLVLAWIIHDFASKKKKRCSKRLMNTGF